MARRGIERRQLHREILTALASGRGDEWRGKQWRRGTGIGCAVGRVCAENSNRERFDGRVKHAETGAQAGLSGTSQDLAEERIRTGRVDQANAGREIFVARRSECPGNTRIGWKKNPRWSARKDHRLFARLERRNLIVFLVPGFDPVPAQTVIQRKVWTQPPTILRVDAEIFVASIKRLELTLVVLRGSPEQEINEIRSGLAAVKQEAAVELSNGVSIDLVKMKFDTGLDGVRTHDFGKVVEPLERVVALPQLVRVGSDRVVVEGNVLHSLGFWRERHDAESIRSDLETLRRQADAESTLGTAEIVGIAQIAEAEFVHGGCAQGLCVTQVEQLSAAKIQRIEARHISSALRRGIRIVLREIVEKIISRNETPSRVGIEAGSALVVMEGLVIRGGGKNIPGLIR